LKKLLLFLSFLSLRFIELFSQNCSVNAGIDLTKCANDVIYVSGFTAGPLNATPNLQWTQVSGTTVTIQTPNSSSTYIKNFPRSGGIFKFVCAVNCQLGGRVTDTITITILATPNKPNAGRDTTFCPGTRYLNGSIPPSGEIGTWTEFSPSYLYSGIYNSNSYNSGINSYAYGSSSFFKWEVQNTTTNCKDADTVYVVNCGGETVNAGPDRTASPCYVSPPTTFYPTQYSFAYNNGVPSNMGRYCGQTGVWTNVSKPSGSPNPSISNAYDNYYASFGNLYPGVYKFAWTVSGPCASGSDTMQLTVPNPLGYVTPSGSNTSQYLCGQTSTTLTSPALSSGQTFSGWTKIQGPSGDSIGNPNSTSTTVHKLKLPNSNQQSNSSPYPYIYSYTVCASAGVCCATYFVYIYPERPPILDITPSSVNLTCLATTATIPFTYKNMGFGFIVDKVSGPTQNNSVSSYASIIDTIRGNINISGLVPGNYVFRIRSTQAGCASYVSDVVNVQVSGTVSLSNAGSNQKLQCGVDSSNLVGNIPTIGTGFWSQVFGPTTVSFLPNQFSNSVKLKNLNSGTYKLRWNIDGGTCPSNSDDVLVFVAFNPPTYVVAGANKTVCYSTPIVLNGNQPKDNETGTWTITPSGPTFSNINDSNAILSNLSASTVYKLYWTISNSCASIKDSITITTTSSQGPIAANSGGDQCITSGTTSITLTGNSPSPSGAIGTWRKVGSFSGSISSPNNSSTTVTGLSNGHYRFSYTISISGCDSTSDTVDVSIMGTASTSKAGKDSTICGSSLNLYAKKPSVGTGIWSQYSGPNIATFSNVLDSNSSVSNLIAGSYVFRWTVNNGVCPSNYDDVTIQVSQSPSNAEAMRDTTICNGNNNFNTIVLKAKRPSIGTGRWQFLSGPAPYYVSPDTSVNSSVIYLYQSGTYKYLWRVNANGNCPIKIDTVIINSVIKPIAGADIKLCNQNSTILIGNSGSNGTWSQVGNTPSVANLNQTNPWTASISGLNTGTYYFHFSLTAGTCVRRDTVAVTIDIPISTFSIGNDTNICLKDTNTLTLNGPSASSGVKAKWDVLSWPYGYSTQYLGRSDTTNSVSVLNANFTGQYLIRYRLSKGSCVSEDSKIITIENAFTTTIGKDTGRCGGSDTFNLNGTTRANSTYKWSKYSGSGSLPFTSDSINTKIRLTTSQFTSNYIFKVKDTVTACISRDTILTMHTESPVGYAAPSYNKTCGLNEMPYLYFNTSNYVPGTTFSWSRNNTTNVTGIPSTGVGSFIGNYTPNNATGLNQLVIFTVNCKGPLPANCPGNTFYDTLLVLPNTPMNLNLTIDSIYKCYSEPVKLNWNKINKVQSYCISEFPDCQGRVFYTGPDTAIKLNASDQYNQFYIYAIDSNGCVGKDDTYYKLFDTPAWPDLVVKNQYLCQYDSGYVIEQTQTGTSYTFSTKPYGEGKVYYQGTDYYFTYYPDTSDAIRWVYVLMDVGSKGCPGIDSIEVFNYPNLSHTLEIDNDSVCYGQDVTFTVHPKLSYSPFSEVWLEDNYWLSGNFIVKQSYDTIMTVNSADIMSTFGQSYANRFPIHSWYYDGNYGCADTATCYLTIAEIPTCNAGSDINVLHIYDSAQLGSSPTGYCGTPMGNLKYVWSPSDSLNNRFLENPYTKTDSVMTYYVTVTDSISGCYCVDDISILSLLPVKWLMFEANWTKNKMAKLDWTVQENQFNKSFTVQRSYDGIYFEDINIKSSIYNISRTVNHYSFIDQYLKNNLYSNVFYRIKQTDINGNITYSENKELTNEATTKLQIISITPNPSTQYTDILFSSNIGKVTISLYSNEGKLEFIDKIETMNGLNQYRLNFMNELSNGIYLIKITNSNNQTVTDKIIINKS